MDRRLLLTEAWAEIIGSLEYSIRQMHWSWLSTRVLSRFRVKRLMGYALNCAAPQCRRQPI